MKTKLLTGVAVVLIILTNTALADKDHHKDDDSRQTMPGMMMSGDMPMMDMKAMHGHMAKMQKTMKRIHSTEDMKEQQKLMQQHMGEMHEGMGMMQGMMSGPMGDKQMQGKMPKGIRGQMSDDQMPGKMRGRMETMDDDDDMADIKFTRKRHNMMEQRMDMMQGMMGQMMEHMMQQQKMGMGNK